MTQTSFEPHNDLQKFISESSKKEFQEHLDVFSIPEIVECLTLLQTQPAIDTKIKLHDLLEHIPKKINLELLGKHFSVSSFLSFLEILSRHPKYQNCLTPALIGLDPIVFSHSLHYLQDNHLNLLKHEGSLEPLQYQLTQFFHEGEALKHKIEQLALQYQEELSSSSEELNENLLQHLLNKIHDLRNQLIDYLDRASTALALVWHTDRIDLIEKLSSMNESIQHQLTHQIGHSAYDSLPATGLYAFLEKILSQIYDSSLKDDDASIDGLTRLSIWHLRDYWELGLIPFIRNSKELDDKKLHEPERGELHQKFIALVNRQLDRLGIGTVADLKKHLLFSKSLLKAYIEKNRHLLLNETCL